MDERPPEASHYSNSKLTVEVSLRDAAERIEGMNYGIHRFLSHLLDVRAELLAKKIARYRERGDNDIAEYATQAGDPLADGIRKLLEEGCY
jgi:hypothetical protein